MTVPNRPEDMQFDIPMVNGRPFGIRSDLYEALQTALPNQRQMWEIDNTMGALRQEGRELNTQLGEINGTLVELLNDLAVRTGTADENAKKLVSSSTQYAVSTSSTVAPLSGWCDVPQQREPNMVLWGRTELLLGSGAVVMSAPFVVDTTVEQVTQPGAKVVEYQASQGGMFAPTGSWSDTIIAPPSGWYLWQRTTTTLPSGHTTYSYVTIRQGEDGLPGENGLSITSTSVAYAIHQFGSIMPTMGWQDTVPGFVAGEYLWTRTTWTYSDGSNEVGYSAALLPAAGSTDADGLPGKEGVTIDATTIMYAKARQGDTPPSGTWRVQPPETVHGDFVWTRWVWTYSDGTTEQAYSVGRIGDRGSVEEKGLLVSAVETYFFLLPKSADAPAPPTDDVPEGWVTSLPDYEIGTTLYRVEKISYTTGDFQYTTVKKDLSWTSVENLTGELEKRTGDTSPMAQDIATLTEETDGIHARLWGEQGELNRINTELWTEQGEVNQMVTTFFDTQTGWNATQEAINETNLELWETQEQLDLAQSQMLEEIQGQILQMKQELVTQGVGQIQRIIYTNGQLTGSSQENITLEPETGGGVTIYFHNMQGKTIFFEWWERNGIDLTLKRKAQRTFSAESWGFTVEGGRTFFAEWITPPQGVGVIGIHGKSGRLASQNTWYQIEALGTIGAHGTKNLDLSGRVRFRRAWGHYRVQVRAGGEVLADVQGTGSSTLLLYRNMYLNFTVKSAPLPPNTPITLHFLRNDNGPFADAMDYDSVNVTGSWTEEE